MKVEILGNIEPNLSWMDNQFKPFHERFPEFMEIEDKLIEYLNSEVIEIKVRIDEIYSTSQIVVGVDLPEFFKPFKYIVWQVVADYMPDFSDFVFERITPDTEHMLKSHIVDYERFIMSMGGRSFHEEVGYRLGFIMG